MKIKPPLAKLQDPGVLTLQEDPRGVPLMAVLIGMAAIVVLIIIFRSGKNSGN